MEWRGDNFPQYDGGEKNIQTWVRSAGIDIPISANNESFPLGSQAGLGRKQRAGDGDEGEGRDGLAASHSRTQDPLLPARFMFPETIKLVALVDFQLCALD